MKIENEVENSKNSALCCLHTDDIDLLKQLFRRFAGQPFNDDDRAAVHSSTRSGAELQLSFLKLRREGLIQAVKKAWGERLYYIPIDKLTGLYPVFFSPVPSVVHENENDIHIISESKPGLPLDILHVLAYIAEQGLPVTAKGTVHKKNVLKLLEAAHLKDQDLAGLSLQYAHPDTYPVSAAVILDLLFCLDLLTKESQALLIREEQLREWLNLTEDEMSRVLFQTVMERYSQSERGIQHFRYFICQAAFQKGVWFDVTSLLECLENEKLLVKTETEAQAAGWLHALAGFGWGDVGEIEKGMGCFRWNIDPSVLLSGNAEDRTGVSEGGFYVQPDFDIIVPPDVPYIHRWKLLACTELKQSDRMSIYRLTRNSAAQAVEKGMSISEVEGFLSSYSIGEIPGNVVAAFVQWGREIGRTHFEEVVLLSCKAEEDGGMIESHPQLTGRLERIGPKHFIVNGTDIADIRKILESVGLAPLKVVGKTGHTAAGYPLIHEQSRSLSTDDQDHNRQDAHLHENHGLVYSGRNIHYFDADLEIPEPKSLFPGLDQIPVIWVKDFRIYHGSTVQNMMEQAIAWRTRLLISWKGHQVEFIPRVIHDNPWRIEGDLFIPGDDRYEHIELSAGDWSEMRLLVPSFT